MPISVFINSLSVAVGGLLGTLIGERLNADFKQKLNMILGCCSMCMGISNVVLMENMPAVVMAVLLGTVLGLLLHLGDRITKCAGWMQRTMSRFLSSGSGKMDENASATLLTVIVLFCASGTGIYGSMIAGMNGDHSILLTKSMLDLITALIFACSLGLAVSLVAIPQLLIFSTLFFCAGLIFPLTTPAMIHDFKACGGFIMLATGFRIAGIKLFPTADMIPAMVLVMPVSWLWTTFVLPLAAG